MIMNKIFGNFKKVYIHLITLNDLRFSVDANSQKKFLNNLETPINDFQRSYFQYKSLIFLIGYKKWLILQFVSFWTLPLYLFSYIFTKNEEANKIEHLICFNQSSIDKIPKYIRKTGKLVEIDDVKKSLNFQDLLFIFPLILKYPFSFLFLLKVINKLSLYSSLISKYSPSYIYGSNEYNVASSILTKYCESKNIKHYNFMHGEKIYYIRDSFCRFHISYVWDEHYRKLFDSLRHYCNSYIIESPFSTTESNGDFRKTIYDLCYYLSAEKNNVLLRIFEILHTYSSQGNRVCVRMHPIWTNIKEVKKLSEKYGIEIQDNKVFNIYDSILNSRYIASLYSTVLFHAYNFKKNIVIDDLSNPEYFNKLIDLKYIIFEKKHYLFSQLLQDNRTHGVKI